MIRTTTTIVNKLGLHARASAKLTKLAGSFPCEVRMSRGYTVRVGDMRVSVADAAALVRVQ